MGKPRTKRQLVREERKQKRKAAEAAETANTEGKRESKRRRPDDEEYSHADEPDAKRHDDGSYHGYQAPEKEFFGMLSDEEQEYFRRADELLELNQFPSDEERDVFLQNIYREAVGKELKLASSQSLSRLMERLILLSNTAQKKHIFSAFAGHFLSLVQHRFASHCCETLFLQSAPVVTQELGKDTRIVVDTKGTGTKDGEGGDEPQQPMENLFLLTLDEFEEHLGFLMTDKFASHTLRVLLVVLSGRPLEDRSTKSLMKSKNKEYISVQGLTPVDGDELHTQLRAVPSSFTMAVKKIIADATAGMDFTALRVLVKHPTGNPLLQLLLEFDISLNHKTQKGVEPPKDTLLYRLLPGAPASLNDADSEASDFVNSMMYDQIGSRLLETLITHAPGKIFKALHLNFFAPRIGTYVRNDIASYPAIRALNRFSKDDLVDSIQKVIPVIPALVAKGRFNVIRTLYERSKARGAEDQMRPITTALINALEADTKEMIPKLCYLSTGSDQDAKENGKPPFQQDRQNKQAMASHGAHLVATMLATPVAPAKAAQASLLALSPEQLFDLATRSPASAGILTAALAHPSPQNPIFHKALVANLIPRIGELADSQPGHTVVNAIVAVPSRGKDRAVPFHMKQNIMGKLAEREWQLRESWTGRNVWRTWKGDMWKTRPADWARWAKEVDGEVEAKPKPWELLREKQQKQQQKEK
ncbi:pumilio-family RNA binding repeat domain-containing protein [Sodiomyces alkalinus F11]|uniref:Nucleolar protein 9 n=1 Tax=Sodiomyces alkalinus (strain CBS 110278 / VKM F-3762 / F11) TaxID=1314773 RepID=A0A3N2PMH7_SODAK|nr:pumilio-family RNA binding repeat domain-containing protein [Sodiomyces alkalinus F11]ROT35741.1 pumilio-family RNA binding repeat domain-containing protein [Sodiomyces alkalinus F11]